jgi:CRP-like cAMP-binding protein
MPKLNIVEKVIALEGIEVFANLTPDQMARVAAIAKEGHFAPGEFILDQSKRIDALYVIVDGTVDLRHGDEPLSTVGRDHVLGMWAMLEDNDPLQVTAKAVEDTRVLRIDREDFYELLSDHSEITSAIFSTLVKRFRTEPVSSGDAR